MKCNHCGYCCGLKVKLSFLEYFRILLKGYRNFWDRNAKNERCIKIVNGKCYFLMNKKENRCKIYPIRPRMCKEYPGVEECPKQGSAD